MKEYMDGVHFRACTPATALMAFPLPTPSVALTASNGVAGNGLRRGFLADGGGGGRSAGTINDLSCC